uniref:Uncharacterized protein n=1 Tax=Chenopodium quinoa TaxID=63459 RepID=A0A803MBX9_CHEQI
MKFSAETRSKSTEQSIIQHQQKKQDKINCGLLELTLMLTATLQEKRNDVEDILVTIVVVIDAGYVVHELEAQACENENEVIEINGSSLNVTTSSQANDDPMYLKLWEKSKRHKNGKFDDEAEEKSWSVILDRDCPGFRFLGITLFIIGFCMMFILYCANVPDDSSDHNLPISLCLSSFMLLLLLALGIFALAVSSEGGGKSILGISYKQYYVESYSKWMQNKSGCCKPPEECNFKYTSPTVWVKPESGNYSNVDCNNWNNDPKTLCYDCQSCKAALLQDVSDQIVHLKIIQGYKHIFRS